MGNPFGRNVILPLTNQSGGSVAAGDVVYLDTAHDDSFTTGTTANYTGPIGIAQQTIGAAAVGLVLVSGYASLVNVNASVTRGHYGATYTAVKQATDAGASRGAGTFCQFLKGGTTPDAMVWQPDLGAGSGMTNPMTTLGDLITGGTVTGGVAAPSRLGIGNAGATLAMGNSLPIWNAGTSFPGSKATNDRYFRTDILGGMEFLWDGTRWVSTTLYAEPIGPGDTLQGNTGTGRSYGRGVLAFGGGTYNIWCQTVYTFDYVATTNNGTNYYNLQFLLDPTGSVLGSASTAADTADTWTKHSIVINALLGTTDVEWQIRASYGAGTPGAIYLGATVTYRIVAT